VTKLIRTIQVLVFAVACSSAVAMPVVDVDNVDPVFWTSGPAVIPLQQHAQIYAVGHSGHLNRVELTLFESPQTTGVGVTFMILPTIGGLPDSNNAHALYTATIPVAAIPVGPPTANTVSIDVSGAGIAVKPGQQFTFVVTRDDAAPTPPWVVWGFGKFGAGGTTFRRANATSDWLVVDDGFTEGFRAIVDTPDVQVPGLGNAGLVVLVLTVMFVGLAGLKRQVWKK